MAASLAHPAGPGVCLEVKGVACGVTREALVAGVAAGAAVDGVVIGVSALEGLCKCASVCEHEDDVPGGVPVKPRRAPASHSCLLRADRRAVLVATRLRIGEAR